MTISPFKPRLGARHRQASRRIWALTLIGIGGAWAASGARVEAQPNTQIGGGGKIAFVSSRDGNPEIYVMNVDGTAQRRLTTNTLNRGYDFEPSINGTTGRIAFTSDRDGDFDIYSMNADGSDVRNLTNNASTDGQAAWSPDGSKIAFASNRDNAAGTPDIYVMDADGSNVVRLTSGTAFNVTPAWNGAGSRIALTSTRDGNAEIYVIDALDGGNPTRITEDAGDDIDPAWSPDGTRIAFASDRTDPTPDNPDDNTDSDEIYVVNAPATGAPTEAPARLTFNTVFDDNPAFSPDGTRIAFFSERSTTTGQDIYVMNADGSAQTALTNAQSDDYDPSWDGFPVVTANATSAPEAGGVMIFTVSLSRAAAFPITVSFFTSSTSASPTTDYTTQSGDLTFAPGETTQTVTVTLHDDDIKEPTEVVYLNVGAPANATLAVTRSFGSILDDDNRPPQNISIDPAISENAAGETRIFHTVVRDPDGAADLSFVIFRISDSRSNTATNSIVAFYNVVLNKVFLLNDPGTRYGGGYAPGSARLLSNSQGVLNIADMRVEASGQDLNISWSITAKKAVTGEKQNLYLYARDRSQISKGYDAFGTWTIGGNLAPSLVSLAPSDVQTTPGQAQEFLATYSDPNGFKNLSVVMLRAGGTQTGGTANTLTGYYSVTANRLYLLTNDGRGYLGGFAPGSNNLISNAQGTLDCRTTRVSGSGNNLSVSWNFSAAATFSGSRDLFLFARDRALLVADYTRFGTWTIGSGLAPSSASPLVSVALASAAKGTITLHFERVLDAASAANAHYTATLNGAATSVTGAVVSGDGRSVSLQLGDALHSGDRVQVSWQKLRDAKGNTLSGSLGPLMVE